METDYDQRCTASIWFPSSDVYGAQQMPCVCAYDPRPVWYVIDFDWQRRNAELYVREQYMRCDVMEWSGAESIA